MPFVMWDIHQDRQVRFLYRTIVYGSVNVCDIASFCSRCRAVWHKTIIRKIVPRIENTDVAGRSSHVEPYGLE